MKRIVPNIMVQNCQEAIKYYEEVFGGEIKNVQTADGKEMFKGYEGKIVHSELHVNPECLFYFGDVFNKNQASGNISLILELESEEEINRLYSLLQQNGSVKYELQKTFWGAFHAIVTDYYGVSWSLNYSET